MKTITFNSARKSSGKHLTDLVDDQKICFVQTLDRINIDKAMLFTQSDAIPESEGDFPESRSR